MKQGGVGENAIEGLWRQRQIHETLVQRLATGILPGHFTEFDAAIESDRSVSEIVKIFEVPAGAATKIEDVELLACRERGQERCIVLGHVMVYGA